MCIPTAHPPSDASRGVALDGQPDVEDQQVQHIVEDGDVKRQEDEESNSVGNERQVKKRYGGHCKSMKVFSKTEFFHQRRLCVADDHHHDNHGEQHHRKNC